MLFIYRYDCTYIPGPTPNTVTDPGAICVLPASFTKLAFSPNDLASLANCNLQHIKRKIIFIIFKNDDILDIQNVYIL